MSDNLDKKQKEIEKQLQEIKDKKALKNGGFICKKCGKVFDKTEKCETDRMNRLFYILRPDLTEYEDMCYPCASGKYYKNLRKYFNDLIDHPENIKIIGISFIRRFTDGDVDCNYDSASISNIIFEIDDIYYQIGWESESFGEDAKIVLQYLCGVNDVKKPSWLDKYLKNKKD